MSRRGWHTKAYRLLWLMAFLAAPSCGPDRRAGESGQQRPAAAAAPAESAAPAVTLDSLLVDTAIRPVAPWGDGADYIQQTFVTAIGEAPRLAWIVPPDRLLAQERHARLIVYGEAGVARQARFTGVIAPAEHRRLSRTFAVACEDTAALAQYSLATSVTQAGRVFFTSGADTVGLVTGRDSIGLNRAATCQPSFS